MCMFKADALDFLLSCLTLAIKCIYMSVLLCPSRSIPHSPFASQRYILQTSNSCLVSWQMPEQPEREIEGTRERVPLVICENSSISHTGAERRSSSIHLMKITHKHLWNTAAKENAWEECTWHDYVKLTKGDQEVHKIILYLFCSKSMKIFIWNLGILWFLNASQQLERSRSI